MPIDATNWRAATRVRVHDEQVPFVADHQPIVLVIIAKAYVGEGGGEWEPLGYRDTDGTFVAVLGLVHDGDRAELRNFAVDHRSQGRGVGAEVLVAVVEHLRRRGTSTLMLTVHPDNGAAIGLYRRAGLTPTGAERDGQPIFEVHLASPRGGSGTGARPGEPDHLT